MILILYLCNSETDTRFKTQSYANNLKYNEKNSKIET